MSHRSVRLAGSEVYAQAMDFTTAALAERGVDLEFVHQWSCEARRAASE